MNYIDGFVLPLPKDNIEEYRKISEQMGELWIKHGALAYHECIAEDVKKGEVTSFPQAVKLEDGETVIFAWAVYKSRTHRDEVMEKVMQEPFFTDFKPADMPFDTMRMFWGGFEEIVSLQK